VSDIKVNNYAAVFIDILGQREELKGCGLLPDNKDEVILIVKRTVGVISRLHSQFEEFYSALTRQATGLQIPEERRQEFINLQATSLKFQRFSDGLVVYISLAQDAEHSPINGVYGLIAASGSLCLLGLAQKTPLRAGFDIAWGVELNESELYGCVVARSYELESSIAKSPRVVLGEEVIQYLEAISQVPGDGVNEEYGRKMASVCREMITKDEDGQYIVDYLGAGFRKHIANNIGNSIYNDALNYIEEQINHWMGNGNEELMQRYHSLKRYFEKNRSIWKE
jgi:hypothetical protein